MRRSQPWRTNRARSLRSMSPAAEELVWAELRDRRLQGLKIIRQGPIGPYFVDSVCRERKLIVEVDGGTHGSREELRADNLRSEYVEALGYRVSRAHNDEVYTNLDGVLDSLIAVVHEQL